MNILIFTGVLTDARIKIKATLIQYILRVRLRQKSYPVMGKGKNCTEVHKNPLFPL